MQILVLSITCTNPKPLNSLILVFKSPIYVPCMIFIATATEISSNFTFIKAFCLIFKAISLVFH